MTTKQIFKFDPSSLFCHRLDENKLGLRVEIPRHKTYYSTAYCRLVKLHPNANNCTDEFFCYSVGYEIARGLDLTHQIKTTQINQVEKELKTFGTITRKGKGISYDYAKKVYFYEFQPSKDKIEEVQEN